jgi:outer membrane lipoprotein-sorting protein
LKRAAFPLLALFLFSAAIVSAAEPRGAAFFGDAFEKLFRKPFSAGAALSIRRPAWSRNLFLTLYYRDPARSLARITGSQREMGTVLLRSDGRVYLYFPRAELLLRLPPPLGSFPLFGSDFSGDDLLAFGDLAARFAVKSDGEETFSGTPALRYRLAPRDANASERGEIRLWVDRTSRLPLRQDFISPAGQIVREVTMESDGRFPFPARWRARTFGPRGGESELLFRAFERDHPVSEKFFTVEGLRQWR